MNSLLNKIVMSRVKSSPVCIGCNADQWSPLNPEGKKHYDREFLLQFQYEATATSKPAGLPDIPDIVLDKVCMQKLQSAPNMENVLTFYHTQSLCWADICILSGKQQCVCHLIWRMQVICQSVIQMLPISDNFLLDYNNRYFCWKAKYSVLFAF